MEQVFPHGPRRAGNEATVDLHRPPADLLTLEISGGSGFDADPRRIRTGDNSGHQALHIAAQTGAARVLLCGFDMTGCHWHGPHPSGLKVTSEGVYERWRRRFEVIAPELAARGVDVVNCTPGSALDCFRRADLVSELETECPVR